MNQKDKIDTSKVKVDNQKMIHQDTSTKDVSSDTRANIAKKKINSSK